MHPPRGHAWIPKTESERPSSSRSNQKVPSRISRAITHAVSTILPSSSNQQVDQVTRNLPTHHHRYTSATGSTPASGLSSILARRVACEPTTPDVLLHAPQLTLGATNAPGATSSHIIENQRSGCKENLRNPFSRTNLLTTTPAFKDASGTAPRGPRKYSRNPELSTGASTSANPALRDPIATANNSHKDKKGIPSPDVLLHAPHLKLGAAHAPGVTSSHIIDDQRSGCKETLPNPFSRTNLLTTTPTFKDAGFTAPRGPKKYRGKPEFDTGASTSADPALRDPIITTNYSHKHKRGMSTRSARKFVSPSPDSGNPKSATGTSGGTVSTTGPVPPSLLVPRSVPKVTTTGPTPPTLHVTRSAPRARDPIPLGENCQLCAMDLAFLPCNSGSGSSRDPPVCAILPCGHCLHASCLDSFYGSSLEPQCPTCPSDLVEGNK